MWKKELPRLLAALMIMGLCAWGFIIHLGGASGAYGLGPTSAANITITMTPAYGPTVTNGSGASSVTADSARLNGEITDTGNENPDVWVYWGESDGADNPAAWTDNASVGTEPLGTYYYDVSSLNATTTYYYRMYAENSFGSDWADTSANFTTSSGLQPPSGLTLTDLGGHIVTANWSLGTGSTYTLIRISRSDYPGGVTTDQWLYYDTGTSVNITGWPLDTQVLYVSAWGYESDNTTYSSTYAYASIGGEGMEEIADAITTAAGTFDGIVDVGKFMAQIILVLGLFVIALWQRNNEIRPVIYFASASVSLFFGITWWETYSLIGWSMVGLSMLQFILGVLYSMGGPSKGISQFKGLKNKIREWF